MKFSELVASSGHDPEHVSRFTINEGEERAAKLKRNPHLIVFCENITEAEALVACGEDGDAVQYVPSAILTDEIKEAALRSEPSSFEYIADGASDTIIELALALDGMNLQYLETSKKTQGRCINAVAQDTRSIRFCNPAVFDSEE